MGIDASGTAGAEDTGPQQTGIEQALAAPEDPLSDPGPGERSGLSSRIAEELLEDDWGTDAPDAAETPLAPARAVEVDDPARAVGDDPEHPIHGSMAEEFENH